MVAIVKGVPFPLVSGVTIPPAPPTYFLPSAAGLTMPPGCTGWVASIDQTNIPPTALMEIHVEYFRDGIWVHDVGAVLKGGSHIDKNTGLPTFLNKLSSSIGARDGVGALVGSYPTAVRLRVAQAGAWLIPAASLTVF